MTIAAIIVTYHPDKKLLLNNIYRLKNQVNEIFIVDNTPNIDLTLECLWVNVINNKENLGIAKAQNQGIECAKENNVFAVLFDQDSYIDDNLVNNLYKSILSQDKNLRIACIGPRIYDLLGGEKLKSKYNEEIQISKNVFLTSQIIASGKLINLNYLPDIGLMDESLFIDGVDHEWCWRARNKGYSIAIDDSILMRHTLGDSRASFLGLKYKVASPIRLYYQSRNVLNLSCRSYVPKKWKYRNLIWFPVRFFIYMIQGPSRYLRCKYMILGVVDFIRKRSGKFDV
ncbi:MAG: glycosyltransferase family 2 protein [Dysgonomonas sp.]